MKNRILHSSNSNSNSNSTITLAHGADDVVDPQHALLFLLFLLEKISAPANKKL
jgi:hypothetical protein